MRRNMDLIRSLLAVIEAETDPALLMASAVIIEKYSQDKVVAHVGMLDDAGFIEGNAITFLGNTPSDYTIQRLTWKGHEFLNAARSDTIWSKATQRIAGVGGSVSIATMGEVLGAVAKEMLQK